MRVLSFDGAWTAHEVPPDQVDEQVEADQLTWVRAAGVPRADLEQLCRDFNIHPLAIEDIQSTRQRPKVEAYPGMTFLVIRIPRWHDKLEWIQVGLFVGKDFLITASPEKLPELDAVEARLLEHGLREPFPDGLFYRTLDALIDTWFPYMDELEEYVEGIEEKASKQASHEILGEIREIKQVASRTRKVANPMRDAMLALERGDLPNIRPEARLYLRDVSDHMVRMAERLEHVRESAMFAQESWNATLANSQNQTMKRLTVVFALFLVPTFLAGIGGMNFEGVPQWPFATVAGTLFLLVLGGGFISWRRGWL